MADEPGRWLNHYKCPECGHEWDDEWSCQCDDDCPACGKRHISPHNSTDQLGPWECVEEDYTDGDGFTSPTWRAVHRDTGESVPLQCSRFRFQMTPERFAWLVANDFPRPARGPWTSEEIDKAMKGETIWECRTR